MICNPILPGFNPDPSILRVGEDYYIATSTFEWFPGVQIHHSRDLETWRLITARKCTFTLGALMMTSMLFVARVESPGAAIALLSVAAFAHQTLSITVIAMSSDLFRKHEIGTVAGSAGLLANFGVLLFSWAIGKYIGTIGYEPFFIWVWAADMIAVLVLWSLVRAPREA